MSRSEEFGAGQSDVCPTCERPKGSLAFGSEGCPSCGATIPFHPIPSKRIKNRFEMEGGGGGLHSDEEITHRTVLKKYGDTWTAGWQPEGEPMYSHDAATPTEALHGVMRKAAESSGVPWHPVKPAVRKRLAQHRAEDGY